MSCAARGTPRKGSPRNKSASSTTGVPGICLVKDRATNPRYVSWSTYTEQSGKREQKAFSIRKFGYSGAWRMVANVRAEYSGFKIPRRPPAPPEWLKKWAKTLNYPLD